MKLFSVLIFLIVASNSFAQTPVKLWETESVFSGPESVAYDAKRNMLYISNLRKNKVSDVYYGNHFISKVSLSGKVIELKWIDGLTEPTGITVFEDRLYIVERFGVVVFDLEVESVVKRIRISNQVFLNDITVSSDGTIYVSDSSTETIYTIKDNIVSKWYSEEKIARPNGILIKDGRLLIAANTDAAIKAIDISNKKLTIVAPIKRGIIDGVQAIGSDVLVSLLEGYLYRVAMDGKVSEILNISETGESIADFAYIEDKNLLIVPALWQHKLIAYRLAPQ